MFAWTVEHDNRRIHNNIQCIFFILLPRIKLPHWQRLHINIIHIFLF